MEFTRENEAEAPMPEYDEEDERDIFYEAAFYMDIPLDERVSYWKGNGFHYDAAYDEMAVLLASGYYD